MHITENRRTTRQTRKQLDDIYSTDIDINSISHNESYYILADDDYMQHEQHTTVIDVNSGTDIICENVSLSCNLNNCDSNCVNCFVNLSSVYVDKSSFMSCNQKQGKSSMLICDSRYDLYTEVHDTMSLVSYPGHTSIDSGCRGCEFFSISCNTKVGNAVTYINEIASNYACDDVTCDNLIQVHGKFESINHLCNSTFCECYHSDIGNVINDGHYSSSIASKITLHNDEFMQHTQHTCHLDLSICSNISHKSAYYDCSDVCYSINDSNSQLKHILDEDWNFIFSDDRQFHPSIMSGQSPSGGSPGNGDMSRLEDSKSSVSSVSLASDNIRDSMSGGCHAVNLYGYIPSHFGPVSSKSFQTVQANGFQWLQKARDIIKATKQPNYKQARVLLPSKFNFDLWFSHLHNYHDLQIVDYLRFGFPLSLKPGFTGQAMDYNHSSADKYRKHVQEYIDTEIKEKAILGPFDSHPLENYHLSPIMSRPKTRDKRRIIIDLSWKENNSLNSNVTEYYDGIKYTLRYPSLDIIQQRLIDLGPKAAIYKIDISRAFRNLPVDPVDVNFLGLYWDTKYYIDLSIPFGYIHGSACCQRVTDAIRFICNNNQIWLFNYCDDLIGIEYPENVQFAFNFTKNLVQDLGFPVNLDKLVSPSSVATCIGIEISVCDMIFRIPHEKLTAIRDLCIYWSSKRSITKKQFQSLLGKLLYISKCVRYARIFMGRMLRSFRNQHKKSILFLDNEFHKDLNWLNTFLHTFNGYVFIQRPVHNTIYVDASFAGVGAIYGNKVYAYHIPDSFTGSIVHLELINVLIAIRCWSNYFENSILKIYCDNMTVVAALNNYRIKDDLILIIVRNIWLELAKYNIDLKISHVPGASNIYADILSRWRSREKFSSNDVNMLINDCEWFYIDDNFFYLDTLI